MGIDASYSSLTQADKALLRYRAIIEQTTNAQGDMARTINQPANSLRVLQAQLQLASRAIGSLFIPALEAILPPAIAVVQVITEIINALAALVGFEMPEFVVPDSSGYGEIASGLDSIGASAEGAAKEMNYLIGGFDELNVMDKNAGSAAGGSSVGNILGGIELPEYDMFKDYVGNQVDEIVDKIRDFVDSVATLLNPLISLFKLILNPLIQSKSLLKGLATAFAITFAGAWLNKAIKSFTSMNKVLSPFTSLMGLVGTIFKSDLPLAQKFANAINLLATNFIDFMQSLDPLVKMGVTIGALAGEFVAVSDAVEQFYLGNISLVSAVGQSTVAFGLAAAALTAMYGPIGLVAAAITGLTAILVGAYEAQVQLNSAVTESLLYNNGGVAIQEVADAYVNYTNNIVNSLSFIHEQSAAFQENEASIKGIVDQINVWQQEMSTDSTKIVENTTKIMSSFEELQATITSNLQIAQDALITFGQINEQTFSDAGVSLTEYTDQVNEATQLSIEGYEGMFSELTELAKLQQSDPYNISYQNQYNEKMGELFDILGYNLTASTDLREKLNLSGIDFTSLDSLESALSDVTTATSDTITELQGSREELLMFADEISKFSPELGEGIKGKINSVFDWTVADIQVQSQATIDWLKGEYNRMVSEAAGGITVSQEDSDAAMTRLLMGLGSGNASDDAKVLASIKVNSYMVEGVDKAFDDAQETLDGIFKDSATSSVNAYAEQIKSEQNYDTFSTIGQYLSEGVTEGMKEAGIDGTKDYVTSFTDSLKSLFGIHSPSTVMKDEIGVYLAQGMIEGMKEQFNSGITQVAESLNVSIQSYIAPLFSYDKWVLIFQNVNNAAKTKTTEAINEWKKSTDSWINVDVKNLFSEANWLNHYEGIKTAFSKTTEEVMENFKKFGEEFTDSFKRLISDLQDYADRNPIIIEVRTVRVGGYGDSDEGEVSSRSRTIPALASGGVLTAPSLIMAGEYSGAKNNPEIVAPQNIMRETVEEANVSVVSALYELIEIAQQIASKDTTIELDGDEVGRSLDKTARSRGYNLGVEY